MPSERCVCAEINTRHCPVHGQGEVESAAISREQILDAFYDSITGILFLHDQGNLGHTSVLGEVRHSTQRCETQLAEIEITDAAA